MSVDIIMYKVQTLTEDELRRICCMNVNDLDEIDGWELKAYSLEDLEKNPMRFEHIKPFLRIVELMYTRTDYRSCFEANGMPKDVNCYSVRHTGGEAIVSYNDKTLRISTDELEKFTTTKSNTYYVVKRKTIESDVSNWAARTLMNELETKLNSEKQLDLSYAPIILAPINCKIIGQAIVDMYDSDDLYPSTDLAQFTIEIMRAMFKDGENVFIEFQD